MYCKSDLIARYSSWIEYLNDSFRTWWAKGMLCILQRLNYNDLSTEGICNTTYRVSDKLNGLEFHTFIHVPYIFPFPLR